MKFYTTIFLICFCLSIAVAEDFSRKTPLTLKTQEITIKKAKLTIEIADTPQAMQRGLMFREKLDENQGMLFVFEKNKRAAFWMQNTSLPLSIAFLDKKGKILEIYPLKPYCEDTVFSKSAAVKYALEVNQGWFEMNGVKIGDMIQGLPKP